MEQAQLYSDNSTSKMASISALEQIILKQTREIQLLRDELESERAASGARTASWEKRTVELSETASLAETRRKQAQADSERIGVEFDKYREEKEREAADLRERIEQLRVEKQSAVAEAEVRVREAGEEARRLSVELGQLRLYVNESMPTVQTVREMSEDMQKCEAEIVRLKVRNEQLVGDNNALQIRLKSINEILSIQEKQLEMKQTSTGNSSKMVSSDKKYHGNKNICYSKVKKNI